ncbi:hypothetical protein [Cryptosporangium minutisporangium]
MDEWGNNPATVEALATAMAVLAVIFAWLNLRESKANRHAAQAEIAARMRPWVGVFDFAIKGLDGDDGPTLCLLLRNFGPIPAQHARLSVTLEPRDRPHDEPPNPISWQEQNRKVLMPLEDGNYPISLKRFPQMQDWIAAGRDVVVRGSFEYSRADAEFGSSFEATLWLSRDRAPGQPPSTNWRNTAAT